MTKSGYTTILVGVSRLFFGVGVAGLGVQQFIYSDFRPVIFPPGWPSWLHTSVFAYLVGAALVIACGFIVLGKKLRSISLYLGASLFAVFLAAQCPYVLFVQPYQSYHLGLWTDPLKELALTGGAFVMAGLVDHQSNTAARNFQNSVLAKFIPFGRMFFSITMISFGIDHFFYTEFVAGLVPAWIPDHTFWTYFAGVALIGSGVAIILEIRIVAIATLLSVMLLLWFVILHIPRAIADPYGLKGNEVSSVFEALNFSGIALGIALIYNSKTGTSNAEVRTNN